MTVTEGERDGLGEEECEPLALTDTVTEAVEHTVGEVLMEALAEAEGEALAEALRVPVTQLEALRELLGEPL